MNHLNGQMESNAGLVYRNMYKGIILEMLNKSHNMS